jgi:hypothetical protein
MSSRQPEPDDDGFEVPSAHDMHRPDAYDRLYGSTDWQYAPDAFPGPGDETTNGLVHEDDDD